MTPIPKHRKRIPLTNEQLTALANLGIQFGYSNLGMPVFSKPDTDFLTETNSLRPIAWTPAQLRLMADVIESNPTISLFNDGSGRRLDDPEDAVIDYDLPSEV